MSITAIFFTVIGFLTFLLIVIGTLAFIDWRAIIVRRFGPNYKKGLAHILLGGVWAYRASRLIFEGDDAITYSRETIIDGEKVFVNDIVPSEIGFDYDEYGGERLYRVRPGGSIGYSDRGDAPAVDYPAELISCHVLDRTASNYAASVNAESEFNWKLALYGAIAGAIIIFVVLYLGGIVKIPGFSTAQTSTPAQTETVPEQPSQGTITGPVEGE